MYNNVEKFQYHSIYLFYLSLNLREIAKSNLTGTKTGFLIDNCINQFSDKLSKMFFLFIEYIVTKLYSK